MRHRRIVAAAALCCGVTAALSAQTEARGTWTDLTPTTRPVIADAIDTLPDGRLLLRGEVYWTSLDGTSWQPLLQRPMRLRAAVVTTQSGTVFVLDEASGRLLELRDGELELRQQANPGDRLSLTSNDAGTLWFAAAEPVSTASMSQASRLWQSDDGGQSWKLHSNERLRNLVATSGRGVLLALRNRPTYNVPALSTSSDEGRTWIDRVPGATRIFRDPNVPTTIWAFEEQVPATRIPGRSLIRSENGGLTWELAGPRPLASFALTNSGLLGVDKDFRFGTFEGPLLRSNGTDDWQPVPGFDSVGSVGASADGSVVTLLAKTVRSPEEPRAETYRLSTDGGLTFTERPLPRRATPSAFAFVEKSSIVSTTGASDDFGSSWAPSEASSFDRLVTLEGSTVLASADRFSSLAALAISSDAGRTFDDIPVPSVGIDLISSAQPSVNGAPPVLFLLPRQPCKLFQSKDLGAFWQDTDLEPCSLGTTADVYVESFAARSLDALGRALLVVREIDSTDPKARSVWLLETGTEPNRIREPRSDVVSEGRFRPAFASVSFDGEDLVIFGSPSQRSSDGGQTWQEFPAGPGEELVAWLRSPATPSLHYAASNLAAYRSTDDGATWERLADSDFVDEIVDLQLVSDTSVLILTDNGLYRWTSADCVAGPSSLCLGDRFHVAARFSTGGLQRTAQSFGLTEDTGTFWFFEPDNLELIVKVLDGCQVNGHFWVFTAGLTDVQVEIQITDLADGRRWRAEHLGGSAFPPGSDVHAFECGSSGSMALAGRGSSD